MTIKESLEKYILDYPLEKNEDRLTVELIKEYEYY
jgi:hypothetical protein